MQHGLDVRFAVWVFACGEDSGLFGPPPGISVVRTKGNLHRVLATRLGDHWHFRVRVIGARQSA